MKRIFIITGDFKRINFKGTFNALIKPYIDNPEIKEVLLGDMTTEEAVRYIEHGREMAEFFQALYNNNLTGTYVLSEAERIAAKLEKEGS